MKLPSEFLEKMKMLLDDNEYEDFVAAFDKSRYYGLRVNTLKISIEDFLALTEFELEPVPWSNDGFYYNEDENPGKHPHYYAGLYYIQEPSAMLPATVLDAKPGERVLDLCAAPGGKTVKIAADMKGKGLIVANDINPNRAKALIKNLELSGVRNAIVTVESPDKLALMFKDYFDKIIVDAPCSGEGMFRKDTEAARSWGKFKSERCSLIQKDILNNTALMLKPGGVIVYSTCTFSPEENEVQIREFLKNHQDFYLCDINNVNGFDKGRPKWCEGMVDISKSVRLWPHKIKGEGHFTALMKRKGESVTLMEPPIPPPDFIGADIFFSFIKDNLNITIEGYFERLGNNLYCLPVKAPELKGIKVAKFGWYMGSFKGRIFEPSHSLAIVLKAGEFKNTISFSSKDININKYLKGETLLSEGAKGLYAVCVDGYVLGLAKQIDGTLKNLYPKGWRKMR